VHDFKIGGSGHARDRSRARKHLPEIGAPQASPGPEEPALGLSRHVSKLDETSGGGFLFSGFPAGDGHSGVVEAGTKFRLAKTEALPEAKNCGGPFRNVRFH
jgi:hypothetical protein